MSDSAPAFRQLHPASVAVNLLPRTWRVVRTAWPLLLVMFVGGNTHQAQLLDLFVLFSFFGLTIGSTVVHYLTLRYRVAEGRLEIKTGLLNRQVRVIDPKRIQNIETVQNLFHRASGLVEVRIETASGTEVEGLLSALSVEEGQLLVAALSEHRNREPTDEVVVEDVLFGNSVNDLLRYGATATRLGAGVIVVFGVMMEGISWMQPEDVEDYGGRLSGVAMLLLGVGVVTGTWLVGIVTAVVRHYGFRLLRRGGTLIAVEGLFTQRRVELGAYKVQQVTIREPWLRRLLGFGSVHVETAAAREESGGTVSAEAVIPLVDRDLFEQVLHQVLPVAQPGLLEMTLRPPHPSALLRGLLAALWQGAVLGGVVAWWMWPWGLVVPVLLIPSLLVMAWLDHRYQGWLVLPEVVITRRGYLDRRTTIVPRAKLQSLETIQGLIRQRWGLAQLNLRVAGSGVALPDTGWDEALALQDTLVRDVANRPGRVGRGERRLPEPPAPEPVPVPVEEPLD